MGADDREEEGVLCLEIPEEVMGEMICSALNAMEAWLESNEGEADPEAYCAALLIAAKIMTSRVLMGAPEGVTLQ